MSDALWYAEKVVVEADAGRFDAPKTTELAREVIRLNDLLNTPELIDFLKGVQNESAHQRERWPSAHDAGKDPEDWFWLLAYLGGKALRGFAMSETLSAIAKQIKDDDTPESIRAFVNAEARRHYDKGIHHTITSGAACANWHLNVVGADTTMRAGRPLNQGEKHDNKR